MWVGTGVEQAVMIDYWEDGEADGNECGMINKSGYKLKNKKCDSGDKVVCFI